MGWGERRSAAGREKEVIKTYGARGPEDAMLREESMAWDRGLEYRGPAEWGREKIERETRLWRISEMWWARRVRNQGQVQRAQGG
jgi:hypothetical protein